MLRDLCEKLAIAQPFSLNISKTKELNSKVFRGE